jgi:DNA repair and recombination protein RAD52
MNPFVNVNYVDSTLADINTRCRKHARLEDTTQRQGGGGVLTYMEGNAVIDNMNEVFGAVGWTTQIVSLIENVTPAVPGSSSAKYEVLCRYKVTVTIADKIVSKEDVGFGGGGDREKANKEAVTDALKRCCRQFGNYFGNSLYDKGHLAELDAERKMKNKK